MLGRRRIENGGAQPVAVGVTELKLSELLGMRVEQPGMVDEREQNERLARGKRAAQTAHERTCREARTRHRRRVTLSRGPAATFPTIIVCGPAFPSTSVFVRRPRRGGKQRTHPLVQILPVILPH